MFGGMTVLSAIFAQSLMIVNFPCRIFVTSALMHKGAKAYNDAVLPDLNMIPDSGSLHNCPVPYVYVIPNFHWIVVEVAPICLVRRPMRTRRVGSMVASDASSWLYSPHDTPFTNEAVPP